MNSFSYNRSNKGFWKASWISNSRGKEFHLLVGGAIHPSCMASASTYLSSCSGGCSQPFFLIKSIGICVCHSLKNNNLNVFGKEWLSDSSYLLFKKDFKSKGSARRGKKKQLKEHWHEILKPWFRIHVLLENCKQKALEGQCPLTKHRPSNRFFSQICISSWAMVLTGKCRPNEGWEPILHIKTLSQYFVRNKSAFSLLHKKVKSRGF